jgi:hypothetical protein
MSEVMIELRYGRLRFGAPTRTLLYKWNISKLAFGTLLKTHIRVVHTSWENKIEVGL